MTIVFNNFKIQLFLPFSVSASLYKQAIITHQSSFILPILKCSLFCSMTQKTYDTKEFCCFMYFETCKEGMHSERLEPIDLDLLGICFICHIYPPFTRKRIVSLYFGR